MHVPVCFKQIHPHNVFQVQLSLSWLHVWIESCLWCLQVDEIFRLAHCPSACSLCCSGHCVYCSRTCFLSLFVLHSLVFSCHSIHFLHQSSSFSLTLLGLILLCSCPSPSSSYSVSWQHLSIPFFPLLTNWICLSALLKIKKQMQSKVPPASVCSPVLCATQNGFYNILTMFSSWIIF